MYRWSAGYLRRQMTILMHLQNLPVTPDRIVLTREDQCRLRASSSLSRQRGTRPLAAYTPASQFWYLDT